MLAYELYLKNRENSDEAGPKVPIKKVFVKVDDNVTLQLDSKTLEHYGENINQNDRNYYFQKSLSMPSNNLASVGLPYRGTGAAAKKPYIEFYGGYKSGKLRISIQGGKNLQKQKVAYEYLYDFKTGKELSKVPADFLVLRLDKKNYFVGDKLLFEAYKEAGVINSEGALPAKVFLEVCKAFFLLWQEKIVREELKEFSSFSFRIVVLPYPVVSNGKVEYHCEEATDCQGEEFEDSFGNSATGYPSKATINAKFISFDDEAFTINCKTGKEFYQNLGIGDQSFLKINLPSAMPGLNWYFFDVNNPLLQFDGKRSGIYDQLLSNYQFLSTEAGKSAIKESAMKIICATKAQAKLEVLLDENLTLEQLKHMLSRAQDNFAHHPMAIESLIVKRKNDVIWTDYITAIRHFLNGTLVDRTFLIQRFTLILRENLREWLKGNRLIKKETDDFFSKSQFCLKLLTKNESGLAMNKNEDYAFKIGVIAGKYVKFKREKREANNSTNDILTYSKYDRERLRFVYQRVGIGVSLSKVNTDALSQSIKNDLPKEEIDDAQSHEDYSYFFYKGVFENLT